MVGVEQSPLADEIKSAIFFFLIAIVTSSIAYVKGFYKLEKSEKINLPSSYALSVFFIYAFFYIGLGSIIGKYLKGYITKENSVGISVFFTVSISLVTLLVLYVFCLKKRKEITFPIIKTFEENSKSPKYDMGFGIFSWLVVFPLVTFFSSIFSIFIYAVFRVQKIPDQVAIYFLKATMNNPIYFILAMITIVILAPILEEFFFRGIVQNFFKKFLNRWISIIFTSLVFAFVHFSYAQKLANITIVGSIFIFSLFLGFIYEKQKSLISPIFLHATFNAINVLNLLFIKGI
ncbi:MAG: hypothetical protein KR126chlam5_00189 [Candidatus Anoxychlamydiales bacterium]|nr:hypothetical protein [Candidatus Anoxychlamydiales bacterium]